MQIKVKYFDQHLPEADRLPALEQSDKGDLIDLRAAETVELKQFEFYKMPLGVAIELPEGHKAQLVPRSSTFAQFGVLITNSPGQIDESYKGDDDQWFAPLFALRDTKINRGDRICQFDIFKKMPRLTITAVKALGNGNRGGHGSTGRK